MEITKILCDVCGSEIGRNFDFTVAIGARNPTAYPNPNYHCLLAKQVCLVCARLIEKLIKNECQH